MLAWSILKLFALFNIRKTKYNFFGILYSNIYNKSTLTHQIENFKKVPNKEILLHIGKAKKSEKHLFSNQDFSYHFSEQRINEKKLI